MKLFQFKEQLNEEREKLNTQIDVLENQGDREILDMNTMYTVQVQRLTKKVVNAQKQVVYFQELARM